MALVETLTDNFDDGVLAAVWDDVTDGHTEADGRLTIAYTNGERYIGALAGWDLRDSMLAVEVPALTEWPGSGSLSILLLAWVNGNNQAAVQYADGGLFIKCRDDGANLDTVVPVPYLADAHRWWRIRAVGSTLHFETSYDGATWDDTFGETRDVTWADDVDVYLDVAGTLSSGSVSFDNLNLIGDPPAPPVPPAAVANTGGRDYGGFLAAARGAAHDAELDRARGIVACEFDGEPLDRAGGVLHCRFCGRMWRTDGTIV